MRKSLSVIRYALPMLALFGFTPSPVSESTATQQTPDGNYIELLALNQPPCATLSKDAVITAKLLYRLAPQEHSELGYQVSIKFQGTDPRMTFSVGRTGGVTVTQRQDTLTLQYPMAGIWNNARLKRPLTCYFYLHRNTGEGRSTVIAKTPPIVFSECQ